MCSTFAQRTVMKRNENQNLREFSQLNLAMKPRVGGSLQARLSQSEARPASILKRNLMCIQKSVRMNRYARGRFTATLEMAWNEWHGQTHEHNSNQIDDHEKVERKSRALTQERSKAINRTWANTESQSPLGTITIQWTKTFENCLWRIRLSQGFIHDCLASLVTRSFP